MLEDVYIFPPFFNFIFVSVYFKLNCILLFSLLSAKEDYWWSSSDSLAVSETFFYEPESICAVLTALFCVLLFIFHAFWLSVVLGSSINSHAA